MVSIILYPPDSDEQSYEADNYTIKDGVLWFRSNTEPPEEIRTTVPFIIRQDATQKKAAVVNRRSSGAARGSAWS